MVTITFDERICLQFDPFSEDYAGNGNSDKVLSNKIVTVRKERDCMNCGEVVKKGTRARVQFEIYDGESHSATFCNKCCKAMADVGTGKNEESFIDRCE